MELPLAPIERLIRDVGARRVSEGAKKELASALERRASELTKIAVDFATKAKRKTIKAEDVKMAVRGV